MLRRRIVRRNKRFLTRLLRQAVQWDLPLSTVVNFSADSAESRNACRLKRRGKLRPDWGRVELLDDSVFLPFSGPSGKIYYYNELSALECLLERSLQDVREGLFIDPRELLAQRKAVRRR